MNNSFVLLGVGSRYGTNTSTAPRLATSNPARLIAPQNCKYYKCYEMWYIYIQLYMLQLTYIFISAF